MAVYNPFISRAVEINQSVKGMPLWYNGFKYSIIRLGEFLGHITFTQKELANGAKPIILPISFKSQEFPFGSYFWLPKKNLIFTEGSKGCENQFN